MSNDQKLCRDCKHHFGSMGYSFCYHPSSPRSVVSGEPVGECHAVRANGECGVEAKWFEEKTVEPPKKRSVLRGLFWSFSAGGGDAGRCP